VPYFPGADYNSKNQWFRGTDELGALMVRFWLISAAISGFLSVLMGAFGAHSLNNLLDEYGKMIYQKAVLYQMFHTFAILSVGLLQHIYKDVSFGPAGWSFLFGTLLFSGSLYVLALSELKWAGVITPFGGVAFLFGWAWLIFTAIKMR
jgi:uncharacterized membrane protein YgdD (TMEM256/DUF423 family)